MDRIARTFRRAVRDLLRSLSFSVPVTATLALGIGTSVAVFALADAVLLRPLPYAEADRIVSIHSSAPGIGVERTGVSSGVYVHYRDQNRIFTEVGAYMERDLSITDDDPERIRAALITPGVLTVLGVSPQLGRRFTTADVGAEASGAVLLSHDLWVRRYGADPDIVGRTIQLNRVPREIVGVLPRDFRFPRAETSLWFAMPVSGSRSGIDTHSMYLSALGLLRQNASAEEGARDLQRLITSLPEAYSDITAREIESAQLTASVVPLKQEVIRDVRTGVSLLAVAAGFILLVTWANVINLILVRAQRQRKSIAIEQAVGASHLTFIGRICVESSILAAVGGGAGVCIAAAAVAVRFGFAVPDIPRLHELALTPRAITVALALGLLTASLLALVSYLRGLRRLDLANTLKESLGRTTSGRDEQRMLRLLVSLQIGLAVILLIGSSLVARSFWQLRQVPLGFDPANVLAFEVPLPSLAYSEYGEKAAFFGRLIEGVRSIPGVVDVGAVQVASPFATVPSFLVEPVVAEESQPNATPIAATMTVASPGYFAVMRISLIRGRMVRAGDVANDTRPVLVSASLARRLFDDRNPVGSRLRMSERPRFPSVTIVGIVDDVPAESVADGRLLAVYFPLVDDYSTYSDLSPTIPYYHPNEMTVVVRAEALERSDMVAAIRRVMDDIDQQVPMASIHTMGDIVQRSTARIRLTMLLLLIAAGASLVLGLLGIYGTVSYAVAQRMPEFGVRLVLGATPVSLQRMMLMQGTVVAILGVSGGVVGALGAAHLLRGVLFGVSPKDLPTFVVIPMVVMLTALVASYGPARRAAQTHPGIVVKSE